MGEMDEWAYESRERDNEELEDRILDCFKYDIWYGGAGVIHVSEMSDSHIENAINYMKRHPASPHATLGGIEMLEKEQKRRKGVKS